jgi:phage gpG-like protein
VIETKITGEGQVLTGLVRIEGEVEARVRASVARQTLELVRHVKENKLTGQVLKVRTGTLRRSIAHSLTTTSGAITGTVSTPLVYAPIHEFGGTIPARIVEARRAQALKFTVGGKTLFRRAVSIPAVRMPERSFLRAALADRQAAIEADLQAAANVSANL